MCRTCSAMFPTATGRLLRGKRWHRSLWQGHHPSWWAPQQSDLMEHDSTAPSLIPKSISGTFGSCFICFMYTMTWFLSSPSLPEAGSPSHRLRTSTNFFLGFAVWATIWKTGSSGVAGLSQSRLAPHHDAKLRSRGSTPPNDRANP